MTKRNGTTLIELSVYSVLLLTVLTLAYYFFKLGSGYFHKTRAQVELQQAAALSGSQLARDLAEASSGAVASFPSTASPAAPPGLVLLSARNQVGKFCYEAGSGHPIWQSYVGYYLDVDPEAPQDASVRALFRAEISNRGGLPGTHPDTPVVAGVTTQLIKTTGANRHLVAHGLSAETTQAPHGGLDAYNLSSTNIKSYPAGLSNPIWVDLGLSNSNFAGQQFRSRLAVMARNQAY